MWPEEEIEEIDWADYRFRITVRKEKVIPVISGSLGVAGLHELQE